MAGKKEILTINDTKVFLVERTIIDKRLRDAIRSHTEELLEIALNLESMTDPDVKNNVVQEIGFFLHNLRENNHITQWDVMCDRRNNTTEMFKKGLTSLSVKFKQWNCLKPTVLEYMIERKPKIVKKKKSRGRVIL